MVSSEGKHGGGNPENTGGKRKEMERDAGVMPGREVGEGETLSFLMTFSPFLRKPSKI